MGSSTKKTTSTQQQSGTTMDSATTSPNIYAGAIDPTNRYFAGLSNLGANIAYDPYQFTAKQNALQSQAYDAAHHLGDWRDLASTAATAGPNLAGPATTYGGAMTGPAAQSSVTNATAAQAGPAASLLDGGLDRYMNPFLSNVVDTSLADFDANAGTQRAAASNQLARLGAFGGSRAAIAQSALEGDLSRARGALDAGLRSDAFNTAAGLASTDAGRRQETSLFNTGNQQQTNLANAGAANTASMFNAGETNQNARTDAGNATQAGIASMAAQNQRDMFNAGQADTALARQLQAAGLFGQQSVNDVNAMLGAGNSLWDVQNAQAQAPLQAYGALGSLLNPGLIDTFSGQTINSNGSSSMTGSGTETQKSSGGLLGSLGGILSLGSMLIPGIGTALGGAGIAAKLAQKG